MILERLRRGELAVQLYQPLAHDQPQPQEHRHFRLLKITGKLASRLDIRLLNHVRRVDPSVQAPVEPQRDHRPQPIAVLGQRVVPRRRAARPQPFHRGVSRLFRLVA